MIDVLLATYQPQADLLKAQIDSIRAQVGIEVNLICREDMGGLGARENFDALLRGSKAEYVAFSDQDDVWRPEKLVKCLMKLQAMETLYGRETPLLAFCDGWVTDDALKPYPGTNLSRQRVDVKRGMVFNRLLMQNFVAGNAIVMNAALREKAGSIPQMALMHDAWLALVAAAFGHIGFVDEPLYFYRQHEGNALGATAVGVRHYAARARQGVAAFRARLAANVREAQAFVDRFGATSPAAAQALARLSQAGWLGRRHLIVRHGLWKQGLVRNMALLLFA